MVYIYVLQLEKSKWYVGKTTNPEFRLESHFNSNGSAWTSKFKPIKLHQLIPDCDDYDEDKYTMMYMDKYGINNVRGGTYVQIKLEDSVIKNLIKISRGTNDKCFLCGRVGHFVSDCNNDVYDDFIDLSVYINNFDTIEKIDEEIKNLSEENLVFFEIKKHANLVNIINNNSEPDMILSKTMIKKLYDLDNIFTVFDKIKKCIKQAFEQKMNNWNVLIRRNENDILLVDKILSIINNVNEIKKTKEKNNIYKFYQQDSIGGVDIFIRKYALKITVCLAKTQNINDILEELNDDIRIIKLFYSDALVFIKSNQKLLSNYPENYEKIIQTKIIELNKKKLDLI